MKYLVKLLPILTILIFVSSCTTISARKVPGTQQKEFPNDIQGEYELTFPAQFQAFMAAEATEEGEDKTMNVSIKSDRLIYTDSKGTQEMILGDSIYYSKIGKSSFLTLAGNPSCTVLKMVVEGSDIKLYGMYTQEEVTDKDLKKFFSDIKIQSEDGGEEEVVDDGFGMNNYVVTIKDKKLDLYFASKFADKEPFVLKRKE